MIRRLAGAALVLLLAAACTNSDPKPAPTPTSTLSARSPAAVENAVAALAETLRTDLGATQPLSDEQPRAQACGDEDDGPFNVFVSYQLPLPTAEHRAALQRLRDHWTTAGWTTVTYRPFADTRAELTGVNPDDYGVRILSGNPPTVLALQITTPCYRHE
ncbi:hypothetical protein [Cryptosporangium arvum]|uniref:Lipoprotein n=1 Tax=Cryptosporangium arvum DSM 44712 TaxID=927661 RepID=A0A010ZTH1_9ACTN|nr:hypothetical protein [Cryptosporangium arvum]EXG82004.1 hypothetical protein CryarDRAFT_3134 [Cryptosporangium arvum DSM 44712]